MKQNAPQYKLHVKEPSLLVLIMMISLASVGAVLYSPSIPHLDEFFGVSKAMISLTMTLFLLGYSLGQLIYGPLANRFGRKPTLYFGVCVAMGSALFCGLAAPLHSIMLLLWMRVMLAIGSGVGLTVTITMINDYYYSEQTREILPVIATSFAVIPGVAIFTGGLITYYLSWPFCFYFLAFYYFLALLAALSLPETTTIKNYEALKLKNLIDDYWPLRKNFRLLGFSSLVSSCTLFIYVFSALGPIIAKDTLALNSAVYGGLVLIPSACLVFGNYMMRYFARKFSAAQFILTSIVVILFSSLCLLGVIMLHKLNTFLLFALISLNYLVNPILWNSASVMATEKVNNKANASSVLSFINVFGAFLGVLIAGSFAHYPARGMSILFVVVSVYMVIMVGWLFSRLKHLPRV